jgi:6-pyruvoyl-tetrahydropterin synthase related domain
VTCEAPSSVLWKPLLLISAAALAVEIPFLFLGTPSGHDVEFHLYSWLEVLSQWRQGILLPRWASLANFGYGEPRFVFYPPVSWSLGAALSAIFPWTLVATVYIWIALVLAGVSMFFLARRWFSPGDATFAAVLYAVNPYHLVIVYWRSALAELLASWLLPLLLLLILRTQKRKRRTIVFLALLLASSWLINAPAAVMVHYSFGLLILIVACQWRSPRLPLAAAVAVLLGAALAAFYLLPAIYEQKWVDIAQAISGGSRPSDNFLFVHTTDPYHDAFNRLISWVAVMEIGVTMLTAWLARFWRNADRQFWLLLIILSCVCSVLMLPITGPVWSFLPKLQFMQFPWRWLLCLGVPLTLFITMALKKWISRITIYLVMLFVIAFVWHRYQPPWWDDAADLREMQDNMATGIGYEGVDEYTPLSAEPSAVERDARRVTVEGPARAAIHVLQWGAENKLLTADVSAHDNLVLKLFTYPAWHAEVNGRQVEIETLDRTGQMLVPVEAGANRVQIDLVRTWDRRAGGWISAVAGLLAFAILRKSSQSPCE